MVVNHDQRFSMITSGSQWFLVALSGIRGGGTWRHKSLKLLCVNFDVPVQQPSKQY